MQTQVIAAAAAGVAAVGLSPMDSKAEAENAAQLSVALVENAIVILMLVEDHLRLQSKLYSTSTFPDSSASPLSRVLPAGNTTNKASFSTEPLEAVAERRSSSSDSGGLPLDVCFQLSQFMHIQSFFKSGSEQLVLDQKFSRFEPNPRLILYLECFFFWDGGGLIFCNMNVMTYEQKPTGPIRCWGECGLRSIQ